MTEDLEQLAVIHKAIAQLAAAYGIDVDEARARIKRALAEAETTSTSSPDGDVTDHG